MVAGEDKAMDKQHKEEVDETDMRVIGKHNYMSCP